MTGGGGAGSGSGSGGGAGGGGPSAGGGAGLAGGYTYGYGLFVVGALDLARLTDALAEGFSVSAAETVVAAEGDTTPPRPVACAYRPVTGDVSWHLEIRVREGAPDLPGGPDLGRGIAARLDRTVLYEAELFRPSAYWVVTPGGAYGRARLHGPQAEGGGQPRYVLDAAEIPVPGLPHVPVEIIYEAIGDRCGFAFAEALRRIVDALAGHCPQARTAVLRGSLATDTADRFSDFDLVWTVPDADFAACVAAAPSVVHAAHPLLLPARSDPDFHARADRRLLFFTFRDLPLFWRLDLEIRAESGSPPGPLAPPGGGWPLPASALANAVAAVKAVRRDRPDAARGLVDRGFERLGSRRRATGRWPEDIRGLADAAEAMEAAEAAVEGGGQPGIRAFAERVRGLVAGELE
ncbi:nucleotidyltransferase domain-containing protein [Streptomyces varsoviensis]|uniref:nucleotidyltransferase domain-containing protein n=1 Tax=Streptomyces varsoviensis TaxID=67373 RepID=UPI000689C9F2|nr:nucleotidyltransferase domain-containing protein [Streptomyces varsoviensis]